MGIPEGEEREKAAESYKEITGEDFPYPGKKLNIFKSMKLRVLLVTSKQLKVPDKEFKRQSQHTHTHTHTQKKKKQLIQRNPQKPSTDFSADIAQNSIIYSKY